MVGKWRSSTWGKEISLEYGKALRGHDVAEGQYRVFGANGPIGWTSEFLASGPGVILGRKGAYRGVNYSADPFFVIDTAYYVVPKSDIDMRWLYYAIRHYKLGEIDDGSPIPSTTRAAVYVRELDIPPLDEQSSIARILGALDDKIELNRRMNETLEEMAQALFKSWFVDFDAVRAKMDGRALNTNDGPMNWPLGSLIDLCELKRGYDLPAAQRSPGRYPVVSSSGISGFHSVPMAQGPGVVTGRYGTIGEVYFINEPYWPLNTALYVRDFKGNCPRFVFYSLQHVDFLQYSDKAAVPGINRNHLHQAPMVLPPRAVQQEFEKLLTPVWTKQDANKAESRTLISLRDTLLPKLISGELRVKAAEKIVEAVA